MAAKPRGFPAQTGNLYTQLDGEARFLHAKWNLYCDLYGSEASVKVLNDTVPGVFNLVSESLRVDLIIGFARILDPLLTGKGKKSQQNLTLESLVNDLAAHCPKSFHDQILAKLQALKVHCQPIVQWRNKRLAHKDLGTALRVTPNPLPHISGSDIQKALEMLADLLNDVLYHFEEGHVAYGAARGMIGSGKDLILYLKNGMENMERDRRKRMGLED